MIIGLIGYKQSGKTTAAKYLESKGFVRVNFKDLLIQELKQNFPDLLLVVKKEIARYLGEWGPYDKYTEVIGVPFPDVEDITDEHLFIIKPPIIRALMQNYGTEVRRRDSDDYWTCAYLNKIAGATYNIVTDDVRFLNEAEAIKSNGGQLIRVVREDITTGGTHISETEHLKIKEDYTITVAKDEQEKLYQELNNLFFN